MTDYMTDYTTHARYHLSHSLLIYEKMSKRDLVVQRWVWVRHSTCKRKWGECECECECVPCSYVCDMIHTDVYVCDMTHTDVYVCVLWLIQTCMCVWYDSYRRVCVCDITHTDMYVCVIWLIQMCDVTRSFVYDCSRTTGARDMNKSRTRAVIHTATHCKTLLQYPQVWLLAYYWCTWHEHVTYTSSHTHIWHDFIHTYDEVIHTYDDTHIWKSHTRSCMTSYEVVVRDTRRCMTSSYVCTTS